MKRNKLTAISFVDRKNNTIGYTLENSVPCCIICNKGKSTFSYEFFISWIINLKINTNG